MRAVTGTITSTKPCSTVKAGRILQGFETNAAGLLSSDAATYLRTAIEAANDLHLFRGYLRVRQQREGGGGSESKSERRRRPPPVDEDGGGRQQREGGGGESQKRHRPAPVDEDGRWEPKVEEEEEYVMTVPAPSEKKISGRKGSRGNEEPWEEKEGVAAPYGDLLHSPASEKRRKKKEKHVEDEDETGDPIKEQSRRSIDSGMKKKHHLKQEDLGVEEAEQKMVHVGAAENGLASEEKRRKKRKHTEEKEVKNEVVDDDGDLGSDKKRKKKRGRDGDNGNDTELVEHTKKKQRK